MNARMAGMWVGTAWLACAAAFATDADYVEAAAFTQTVSVAFAGSTATVSNGAGAGVAVLQDGASVALTATVAGVEIRLSGAATNASLKLGSSQPVKLVLAGVDLASATNPAIGVWTSNRCFVVLAKGTTNVLADGAVNAAGGAFYGSGPLVFSGPGLLNVSGMKKHAISGAGSVRIRAGEIVVPRAASDAIHAGAFRLDDGTLKLAATGDGIDAGTVRIDGGAVSVLSTSNDTKGIKSDGAMEIHGGLLDLTVRGAASKGLKCADLAVAGGTLLFRLTGGPVLGLATNVTTNGTTVATNVYVDPSYCAAIKCDSNLTVDAGTIVVTHSGLAGKGLSADGDVTINGGTLDLFTSGGTRRRSPTPTRCSTWRRPIA
jgi:adhesin HecA-like repeat protein